MADKSIGGRLAEARAERGLSQNDVALRLGVRRSRVSAVERSKRLRSDTLRRYAQVYRIPLRLIAEWLLAEMMDG